MALPPQRTSPGSPALLLVPTRTELERLRELGGIGPGGGIAALAGFGPVAAAARTAEICARLRPGRVVLLGIAGTYDEGSCPVGSALSFSAVEADGIGAGRGSEFRTASDLGFPARSGPNERGEPLERIDLHAPGPSGHTPAEPGRGPGLLVTVASASASQGEARDRVRAHPGAVAEDMEGYGVALACALAGIPLSIVRGISNVAGERDKERWRIREALAAARDLLLRAGGPER